MANIGDILASAKLPERTVEVCMRGDLLAEWQDLEKQLAKTQAAEHGTDSLARGGDARKIAERMQQLRDEMRKHEVTFRFRALPSREYSDMQAKHRPTQKQREQGYDLNWNTWPVALVSACAIDPAMDEEEAGKLADTISDAQWDQLFSCALTVNRAQVDVPNSSSASEILAATAPKPKQRRAGGSRGGASSAGNRSA